MKLINIQQITDIPSVFPIEFLLFCKNNDIKIPKYESGRGKALLTMVNNIDSYWTRVETDEFCKKFDITTRDSIQLFNKFEQIGLKTNSGIETGKLYIRYPYEVSNKLQMRKNFSNLRDNIEQKITLIKDEILENYINIDVSKWQLGHKNPEITDNTSNNMVLQPPIQAKYRDNYIFIDSLTKIPVPKKLKQELKRNSINLSKQQIKDYIKVFQELLLD